MDTDKSFFELRNISKYFAKVIANKDVSFSIGKGEILALLGENGAGKSTIMKILYGLYRADEGKIFKEGKEIKINSPKEAISSGISMIQQHFSLVSAHSVIENIILGNVHGFIDYRKAKEEVSNLAKEYDFDIPIEEKVFDLDIGVQQKVEILKALYLKSNLLIMDEPTAVLTPDEATKLMKFVKDYTLKGNSVIFITHKLKEVMEVADRIIVMRNGKLCGDIKREETNEEELAKLMIGKEIKREVVREDMSVSEEVCLGIKEVVMKNKDNSLVLDNINFNIHKGEIFGIAGVSGNGQEELCEAISGVLNISEGSISLNGIDITKDTIRERISKGVGYAPVDRYRDGMIMDMSIAENMILKTSYDKKWVSKGLINKKFLYDYTNEAIGTYRIKATGPDSFGRSLSGGNQQKVVIAREIDCGESLLLLNQPTRGLDLGAIDNIHHIILEERKKGKAILLVSTELSEIFALSDRIAVMYKGKIMGIFKKDELDTKKIGLLMAGYNLDDRRDIS